jgi:uncharacterized protein (TIGR03000 family)
MFQKAFSFGGALLLAGALVFGTPGTSQAQRYGGYRGGSGGVYRGGGYGGVYRGGSGGVYRGGWYGGYGRGGYGGGFSPFGWGGWGGYPSSYGSYSTYSPGYSSNYGVTPAYPDVAYSGAPSAYPDAAYSSPPPSTYQSLYPPSTDTLESAPAQQTGTRAHITVRVPPSAEVWFEGHKTDATGNVREFTSPPLTPGRQFTYTVRARWDDNGRPVEQSRQVDVSAGSHADVSFPVARPGPAADQSTQP